jgi:hypothetical protein
VVEFSGSSGERAPRRIRDCVLQHGYGVSPALHQFLMGRASGIFLDAYFGPALIGALREEVCDRVFALIQESVDTSIDELTRRVERVLTSLECGASARQGQVPCALIGHSKGGAAATGIARRCMRKLSTLGEAGCARLGEVFSSNGINLGAGVSLLAYGAHRSDEDSLKNLVMAGLGGISGEAFRERLSEYGARRVGKGVQQGLNVIGDWDTNPAWRDASPGTLVDGIPLYVANNIALQREGWFRGDYAASATQTTYHTLRWMGAGCGTLPSGSEGAAWGSFCETLGEIIAGLHAPSVMRKTFEEGRGLMARDNRWADPIRPNERPRYFERFTWESYQNGDGIVEAASALGTCWNGGTAVKPNSCHTLLNINHIAAAGGALEAREAILKSLLD